MDKITKAMIKAVLESNILELIQTKKKIVKRKGRELAFEFDVLVEKSIIDILRSEGFGGIIVGEETNKNEGDEREGYILVDPVDGSHNARRGIPFYATLLVYLEGKHYEDVFSSVVFDPLRNKIYYAERNKGAFLIRDGKTNQLIVKDEVEEPIMLDILRTQMMIKTNKLSKFGSLRRFGSIGLATAWIAENILDATIDVTKGTRSLDVLASLFLVKEANGKVIIEPKEDIIDARLNFIAGRKQLVNILARTFWWRRR